MVPLKKSFDSIRGFFFCHSLAKLELSNTLQGMFLSNNDPRFKLIQKAFAASTGVTTDTRQTSNGKLFFCAERREF
jgi:hypothetical protein